jgi:hypothetical protein
MAATLPASSTSAPPVPPVAVPAGVIQRGSRWTRLKAWLRLAYTDIGSKEHHLMLEWIIWMVIVSVVVTVLQQDPTIDESYSGPMTAAEFLILIVFATDYALNIYYAPSKARYIFSFSGIVDLLAIMPSFLIFFDTSSIKFLRVVRFFRFLRILQVVKALQHRSTADEDEENYSLLLDLQLGVIGVSALLLLVQEDALRNLLLMFTLAVAVTTGFRRWLVYKQQPALSIAVLLACVLAAMLYAQQLDVAGQPEWAVWFLVGAVVVALVTWWRIESPAGI